MFEPTLTPKIDFAPVPRVEVKFAAVHADCESATVFRLVAGRTSRVRGGIGVFAAGGFAVVDTECPPAVVATYSAQMFDTDGVSLGFTGGASTTLAFVGTVIHQPLDPSRSVLVEELKGAAGVLSRPFFGEAVLPQGRSTPVWIGFGRGGLVGVDLSCLTRTAAAEAEMESVFGGYADPQLPIVCFRTSLPMGLPQPFFALVKDPQRIGVNTHRGGQMVRWALTADEMAPPAEAIAAGVLTYVDAETVYADYETAEAAYLTYLDAESDFSIAGAGA